MPKPEVVYSQSFLGITATSPLMTVFTTTEEAFYRLLLYIGSDDLLSGDHVTVSLSFSDLYMTAGMGVSIGNGTGVATSSSSIGTYLLPADEALILSAACENNGPGSPPYAGSVYDMYLVIEKL
jgi:hypothetical protein